MERALKFFNGNQFSFFVWEAKIDVDGKKIDWFLKWTSELVSLLSWWLSGEESEFDPWVGKIPWRRKWQPILVFFPGKSLG